MENPVKENTTLPPPDISDDFKDTEIKAYAIFCGGGSKGGAFAGALKYLNERNVELQGCAGTSAGALTALLVACGHTGSEIEALMKNQELSPNSILSGDTVHTIRNLFPIDERLQKADRRDISINQRKNKSLITLDRRNTDRRNKQDRRKLSLEKSTRKFKKKIEKNQKRLKTIHLSIGPYGNHTLRAAVAGSFLLAGKWLTKPFFSLWAHDELGLTSSENLHNILRRKVNLKISGKIYTPIKYNDDISFEDWENVYKFKPIKMVASDVKNQRATIFEKGSSPPLGVIGAACASASYPILFHPKPIPPEPDISTTQLYVDGGLSSNMPSFLFQQEYTRTKYPVLAFNLKKKVVPTPTKSNISISKLEKVLTSFWLFIFIIILIATTCVLFTTMPKWMSLICGLFSGTMQQVFVYMYKHKKPPSQSTLARYLRDITETALTASDNLIKESIDGIHHIDIEVPPHINTFTLNLEKTKINQLCEEGKKATERYFKQDRWKTLVQRVHDANIQELPEIYAYDRNSPEMVKLLEAVRNDIIQITADIDINIYLFIKYPHNDNLHLKYSPLYEGPLQFIKDINLNSDLIDETTLTRLGIIESAYTMARPQISTLADTNYIEPAPPIDGTLIALPIIEESEQFGGMVSNEKQIFNPPPLPLGVIVILSELPRSYWEDPDKRMLINPIIKQDLEQWAIIIGKMIR